MVAYVHLIVSISRDSLSYMPENINLTSLKSIKINNEKNVFTGSKLTNHMTCV